jgi:hypothetical protein
MKFMLSKMDLARIPILLKINMWRKLSLNI